jgi:hypothetical protein
MKNLILFLTTIYATSCATVGAVIDGGKDLGTSIIDSSVKTAGNLTSAALNDVSGVVATVAEATQDVVDVVVENVDKQTDELQDNPQKQE